MARADLTGEEELEARGGIEPPIMVLQTIALPLGDRATEDEELTRRRPEREGPPPPSFLLCTANSRCIALRKTLKNRSYKDRLAGARG